MVSSAFTPYRIPDETKHLLDECDRLRSKAVTGTDESQVIAAIDDLLPLYKLLQSSVAAGISREELRVKTKLNVNWTSSLSHNYSESWSSHLLEFDYLSLISLKAFSHLNKAYRLLSTAASGSSSTSTSISDLIVEGGKECKIASGMFEAMSIEFIPHFVKVPKSHPLEMERGIAIAMRDYSLAMTQHLALMKLLIAPTKGKESMIGS
jgi:hypothetical protein